LNDGLRTGLITPAEYENLKYQYYYKSFANPNSPLGGDIGIHGIGQLNSIFKNLPFVFNWTEGSIAVSNEEIDELFNVTPKGTTVTIY